LASIYEVLDHLVTAYLTSVSDWMMVWLAQQPTWTRARDICISTRPYGRKSRTPVVPGELDHLKDGREIAYLPSFNSTHALWYKRHYFRISRTKVANGVYQRTETLKIWSVFFTQSWCTSVDPIDRILTRDHQIVNALLLEAKEIWNQAQEHHISIFTSNASNHWQQLASRPKRPLQSIVLDDGIKELLLDDARDFLDSKRWYSERGIPFRRGYLLVRLLFLHYLCTYASCVARGPWLWKNIDYPQFGWRTWPQRLCDFAFSIWT
jgi:mitochondrial chaperone BCS1